MPMIRSMHPIPDITSGTVTAIMIELSAAESLVALVITNAMRIAITNIVGMIWVTVVREEIIVRWNYWATAYEMKDETITNAIWTTETVDFANITKQLPVIIINLIIIIEIQSATTRNEILTTVLVVAHSAMLNQADIPRLLMMVRVIRSASIVQRDYLMGMIVFVLLVVQQSYTIIRNVMPYAVPKIASGTIGNVDSAHMVALKACFKMINVKRNAILRTVYMITYIVVIDVP